MLFCTQNSIGLNGFENPLRDPKTADLKRQIGQGIKLKMDDAGNILVRRYARSAVYVKATAGGAGSKEAENSVSADILKLPGQALEADKVLKLFDMKKFQSNINRELRQAYPDRRRLELQCLSAVAFVRSEPEILECPVWVLIVNVVAMDLLKSKLPPSEFAYMVLMVRFCIISIFLSAVAIQRASNVKSRPRLPIPDEDPYSIAGQTRLQLIDASDSSGYGGSNNHAHLLALGAAINNGMQGDDIIGGNSAGNYDNSSRRKMPAHTFSHICDRSARSRRVMTNARRSRKKFVCVVLLVCAVCVVAYGGICGVSYSQFCFVSLFSACARVCPIFYTQTRRPSCGGNANARAIIPNGSRQERCRCRGRCG